MLCMCTLLVVGYGALDLQPDIWWVVKMKHFLLRHFSLVLGQVVQLVRQGTQVREGSVGDRITFGQQLQQAFKDFVNTFLPHMEEEEQVFQVRWLQECSVLSCGVGRMKDA